MENSKRYESGLKVMEELFSQEVRTGMEEMKEISPDLWNMIVSFGFGDLYAKKTSFPLTTGIHHTHHTHHTRRF